MTNRASHCQLASGIVTTIALRCEIGIGWAEGSLVVLAGATLLLLSALTRCSRLFPQEDETVPDGGALGSGQMALYLGATTILVMAILFILARGVHRYYHVWMPAKDAIALYAALLGLASVLFSFYTHMRGDGALRWRQRSLFPLYLELTAALVVLLTILCALTYPLWWIDVAGACIVLGIMGVRCHYFVNHFY